jgi:hypothetical protein
MLVDLAGGGWCDEHGGDAAVCPPCQDRKKTG